MEFVNKTSGAKTLVLELPWMLWKEGLEFSHKNNFLCFIKLHSLISVLMTVISFQGHSAHKEDRKDEVKVGKAWSDSVQTDQCRKKKKKK